MTAYGALQAHLSNDFRSTCFVWGHGHAHGRASPPRIEPVVIDRVCARLPCSVSSRLGRPCACLRGGWSLVTPIARPFGCLAPDATTSCLTHYVLRIVARRSQGESVRSRTWPRLAFVDGKGYVSSRRYALCVTHTAVSEHARVRVLCGSLDMSREGLICTYVRVRTLCFVTHVYSAHGPRVARSCALGTAHVLW